MLGNAGVVKLTSDAEVTGGLHIAEGVETGLALLGMGFAPLWATLSANAMAIFPVLAGVEALTIFADNDNSGTGEQAARECAARWREAGREVRVFMAPQVGADFADWSASA